MKKKFKLPYQNFEQTILLLLEEIKRGPVSVHTLLTALSGRGRILLLLFLALGYAGIPGIGSLLGVFIAYLGLRIAVGRNFIWMPTFLHRKKIPPSFLKGMIKGILKVLKFMKHWSQPRYEWAMQKSATRVINGLMITLVGLCLAVSPPVPLTSLLACLAIFLIAIGLLNDDGVYIVLGYVSALSYFVLVVFLCNYFPFTRIFEWIKSTVSFS